MKQLFHGLVPVESDFLVMIDILVRFFTHAWSCVPGHLKQMLDDFGVKMHQEQAEFWGKDFVRRLDLLH